MKRPLLSLSLLCLCAACRGQGTWTVSWNADTLNLKNMAMARVRVYIDTYSNLLADLPLDQVTHAVSLQIPNTMPTGAQIRNGMKHAVKLYGVFANGTTYPGWNAINYTFAWSYPPAPQYPSLWGSFWADYEGNVDGTRRFSGAFLDISPPLWTWKPNTIQTAYGTRPEFKLQSSPCASANGVLIGGVTTSTYSQAQRVLWIAPDGKLTQSYKNTTIGWDAPGGQEAALTGTQFCFNSDGKFILNLSNGTTSGNYDYWGPVRSDGSKFIFTNTSRADNGGPFIRYGLITLLAKSNAVTIPALCSDGVTLYISLDGSVWGSAPGIAAYDVAAGTLKWQVPATSTAMLTVDGRLYALTARGLQCLSTMDGSVCWSTTAQDEPVAAGDGIVYTRGPALKAFDEWTGVLKWQKAGSWAAYGYALLSHTLIVGTGLQTMMVLDGATGNVLSSVSVPSMPGLNQVAFFGNRMYLLNNFTGIVTAYQSPKAMLPVPVQ